MFTCLLCSRDCGNEANLKQHRKSKGHLKKAVTIVPMVSTSVPNPESSPIEVLVSCTESSPIVHRASSPIQIPVAHTASSPIKPTMVDSCSSPIQWPWAAQLAEYERLLTIGWMRTLRAMEDTCDLDEAPMEKRQRLE